MPDHAIETQDLGRVYKIRGNKRESQVRKELVALEKVNLTVERGELFGLLGPNGAGKTTLIKILTTLLAPTSGWARVASHDVIKAPHLVRPRINMVSGGESSGYGLLTVRENLWMFAQFYGMRSAESNRRIRELLDILKMSDRLHTKIHELSTGLRQKMNIARGFLTDPDVLFLDEPTLGLDVGAARDVRGFIRQWMRDHPDRTILLTTHYMVEADDLCDRVAIINAGRVLTCDTPARLKQRMQHHPIFSLELARIDESDLAWLGTLPGVRAAGHRQRDDQTIVELTLSEEQVLGPVIASLHARGIALLALAKREPTLEDVFVEIVGRRIDEVEGVGATAAS